MATLKAPKVRRARKREDFDYPDLPARHSKNQLQPLFAARVEPNMMDKISTWIEENGLTKRQATEYAFELAMERPLPKPKP